MNDPHFVIQWNRKAKVLVLPIGRVAIDPLDSPTVSEESLVEFGVFLDGQPTELVDTPTRLAGLPARDFARKLAEAK